MLKNYFNMILLKDYLKKSRKIRKLFRLYYSKTRYLDWEGLVRLDSKLWNEKLITNQKQKILVATSVGLQIGSANVESLLAVALTLRNTEVHFLICDSALPACMACEIAYFPKNKNFTEENISKKLCKMCFSSVFRSYKPLGLTIHYYNSYLNNKDYREAKSIARQITIAEIPNYQSNGIAIGEHAVAGALRFMARGDINNEPGSEFILRQFFEASILSSIVASRLLKDQEFDCVLFNHGIYVPHGLIGEVCRRNNIRVVNWNPAYKNKCFVFSHNETYHHTMISEPTENWSKIEWNDNKEKKLLGYLKSRSQGKNDWIWFHNKPSFNWENSAKKMKINIDKPYIVMLTSVVWDAAIHYPSNAFTNMLEWIFSTIQYFYERKDLQLVIRIHPAEVNSSIPSKQLVADEINKKFARLPNNIFIINSLDKLSTYSIVEKCNAAIIYNTKMGVELAAHGIPIIVAGEAWVRNKGFTLDACNQEEYYSLLDELPLPERMAKENIEKAKKYAYHFFFRKFIPLEFAEKANGNPPYKIKTKRINDLSISKSKGLDIICEGIMHGTEFIYDVD